MDLQHSTSTTSINWPYDRRSAWQLSIALAAIGIVTLALLFRATVTSAIKLWWNIPTYNYAFLILPISAYLIWRQRHALRDETPVGSFWGIVVTVTFGLMWLVSNIAGITEGQHIAFVGMLLGILLAAFGWRIFKILSFPFLYLWLLVPTGTVLLPLLQKIATLISSSIVQWLGIPIHVEGFFIDAPSGRFEIAEGCAGLNFILASLALAPLYAYLLYRSLWKRLLAVVVALVLAISMNGVRIAGIISLAHWGGPTLNIAENHLWYGWAFFTVVLFLAGYIGSYFADRESDASSDKAVELGGRDVTPNPRHTAIASLLTFLIVASVFVVAEGVNSRPAPLSFESSPTLAEVPGWQNVRWLGDWSPSFSNADLQLRQSYARGDTTVVDLFVAAYSRQGLGREMITYDNHIIDQAQWSVLRERRAAINLATKALPFVELVVASGDRRRYVWLFYWVHGTFTANPAVAKLLEVKAKLFLGDQRAAIVAISTSDTTRGDADVALQSFLQDAFPSIQALLKTPAPVASTLPVEH